MNQYLKILFAFVIAIVVVVTLVALSTVMSESDLSMVERIQFAPDGALRIEATYDDPVTYTRPWSETRTIRRQTDFKQMAFEWEIAESHAVCDPAGGFWKEDDPWFDNFDEFAGEIIPDLETLKKGMPALPANAEQQQFYLGPFGKPQR